MYSKGFKTILLYLGLGFFAIWALEFRKTTLADSYWALLLGLLCLLWYQLINLKMGGQNTTVPDEESPKKTGKTTVTRKKK